MNSRRFALLVVALVVSPLMAADWPRFRGAEGLGVAADKDIPVSFEPKDALWKTPIPGRGNSSPIVSKGKIFLQSASEDGGKRSVLCVNATTGAIEWSKDVNGEFAKTHNKNTLASSSATADGDRVYIVIWDGKHIHLTAWDYAGNSLWSRDLGGYVSQHGPGLSPIVVGDKVILNVDQDELAEVHAFDRKTGDTIWKKSRPAFRACYTTPFVMEQGGKSEVVVSSTAGVTAYDLKDGAVIWNWTWVWKKAAAAAKGKAKGGPGGALRNVGGPILHNGLIFAISGDGNGDRHMVAIKPGPEGDVTDSALVWERTRETAYVPMVLGHGDYVYWISDKENKAICAEAKTGKEMWNVRLGGSTEVAASPILIDGKIYSIDEKGRVFVFAAAPKFKSLAENDLKEDVFASPAVADGKLYIRGANHLFCFGKR
jgi:outer membrane protein assembly factor BamB